MAEAIDDLLKAALSSCVGQLWEEVENKTKQQVVVLGRLQVGTKITASTPFEA